MAQAETSGAAAPAEGISIGRLAAAAGRAFTAERPRWPLWLPVAFGAGIGLYFALPAEPPVWSGAAGLAAAAGVAWSCRHVPGARGTAGLLTAILVAFGAAGFSAAQLRNGMVAAPVVTERWGPDLVEGRIAGVEAQPDATRLVLDRLRLRNVPSGRTPARVRVRLAGRLGRGDFLPGQRIRVRAVLLPPPPPSEPGAFDFQRMAWFERLGAVGFGISVPDILGPGADGIGVRLARLRQTITRHVRAELDGPAGAVAAALMTGDRAAIPERNIADMRNSGLAHLLAISGLHLGLVAGLIFFFLRAGLALIPAISLRWPVKKWAALTALAGAFGYLLVSGATVPTQRAYLMIGLVFLAVLFDRTAMSMRLVAWAALAVMAVAPESVLTASFQLSFAAVVALIAAYETVGRPLGEWSRQEGSRWLRRPVIYLAGVAMTTAIAGTATGPFAVYHFNRMAMYGIAANLAAVPLVALWIMPWGLAAFAMMPFGLERLPLVSMGRGIDAVLAVAHAVAGWSGSVALVPPMPTWGLLLAVAGGLWLCLWHGRWRLLGFGPILLGLATLQLVRPPDVLISGDAKLMAVQGADGRYLLSSRRAGRFVAEGWLRRAGEQEARSWPKEGTSADGRLACDRIGCIYHARGQTVALVRDERALSEDCWAADVVVSTRPVRLACPGARVVVDRFDLWREGGHALWLEPGRVRVESVNGARGRRPWVIRPAGQ